MRDDKFCFAGVRAWLCLKMGWTEQEFNNQRLDFINELSLYQSEMIKIEEDEQRRQLNKK